jgi:hypothetical protein
MERVLKKYCSLNQIETKKALKYQVLLLRNRLKMSNLEIPIGQVIFTLLSLNISLCNFRSTARKIHPQRTRIMILRERHRAINHGIDVSSAETGVLVLLSKSKNRLKILSKLLLTLLLELKNARIELRLLKKIGN